MKTVWATTQGLKGQKSMLKSDLGSSFAVSSRWLPLFFGTAFSASLVHIPSCMQVLVLHEVYLLMSASARAAASCLSSEKASMSYVAIYAAAAMKPVT